MASGFPKDFEGKEIFPPTARNPLVTAEDFYDALAALLVEQVLSAREAGADRSK